MSDDDFDGIAEHYASRAAERFVRPYKEQVSALRKEAEAHRIEIAGLRRWKAEAVEVLDNWQDAWKAAGRPGPLGSSIAQATAIEIGRLRERVSELEQERNARFQAPFPNCYLLVDARYDDFDVQRMELTVTTVGPFDVDAIRSLMCEYITLGRAANDE